MNTPDVKYSLNDVRYQRYETLKSLAKYTIIAGIVSGIAAPVLAGLFFSAPVSLPIVGIGVTIAAIALAACGGRETREDLGPLGFLPLILAGGTIAYGVKLLPAFISSFYGWVVQAPVLIIAGIAAGSLLGVGLLIAGVGFGLYKYSEYKANQVVVENDKLARDLQYSSPSNVLLEP